MTRIVLIAAGLFILSIMLKNKIDQTVKPASTEVAQEQSWSNKVAGLASDLNALIASEPTAAGQASANQAKVAQNKMVVREEVIDPATLGANANKEDNKLAAVMPSAGGSVNGFGAPSATVPAVAIPANTVPKTSGSAGSANSSSGDATQNGQSLANHSQHSTVPIMNNPFNANTAQDDAIPKVTEQAGKFYVQYGVFASACRSEQVKDKLSQAGIYSVMDKLDPEGEHWIVKSKPFASRAEAIYNLQTAQRKGYESYLVNAN